MYIQICICVDRRTANVQADSEEELGTLKRHAETALKWGEDSS